MGASSTICAKLLVRVLGKLPGYPKLTLNFTRVTVIEATVKRVVRNEATGQVLGVQYIRKGEDHREYVWQYVC
jgi:CTP:molybdopterin cytidylyltransferase MocA